MVERVSTKDRSKVRYPPGGLSIPPEIGRACCSQHGGLVGKILSGRGKTMPWGEFEG
jgi:hypothetical protein